MKPPQEIIDLVDVPPEPNLSFSPDRTKVLQLYKPSPLPPISELARPELKLAGKRSCSVVLTTVRLLVTIALYSWYLEPGNLVASNPPEFDLPSSLRANVQLCSKAVCTDCLSCVKICGTLHSEIWDACNPKRMHVPVRGY